MRIIKFRGKFALPEQDGSQRWVYGDLVQRDDDKSSIFESVPFGNGTIKEERTVITNTVGQSTGMHDKNGTEIYEGDILHLDAWSPYYMQVRFLDGAFCLADKDGHYLGDIYYIHHADHEQSTVMGNIHDNPELLKEKK
jgi:uncharacterized phage protein (TIGR01671 family)